MKRPSVTIAQLSAVIGTIYDCAIDPELWELALERVARLVGGSHSLILMFDPIEARVRYSATWNFEPKWMDRYNETYAADDPTRDSFLRFDVGEPFNIPMLLDQDDWLETRYYKEYCRPKGWLDSLGVTVMKTPSRLVSLAVVRHKDIGFAGPRELEIFRLLAPHLRKAVSIADLIEMRRLTAQTFAASFDALRIPIMLVDRESYLVHANSAARDVLARGDPLRLENDVLRPRTSDAVRRLSTSIAEVAKGAGHDNAHVIFVPRADGEPTFAYVLPLRFGGVRGRIEPRAVAAIFLASAGGPNVAPLQAWASAFGLTAAEVRVLELLIEGLNIVEVADKLDVAATTARTHLARLMRKTGSARQADLVRLALQLAAPLRQPPSLKKL
jgi:DNA-binding CsgD family transcriptional regulator